MTERHRLQQPAGGNISCRGTRGGLARMRDSGRLQVAAQARTLLLRYCANPRAGFWLRMVPPHLVQRVAATFDDAIEACLRETVCSRGAPDDARWRRALKQARLPVRLGGL